jgi:hypothetical protein
MPATGWKPIVGINELSFRKEKPMPDKLLDSERQLLATDRGLKPGVDHSIM